MSPPRGSSMGLRSVRFSELHGRVLAVCMFRTREPSFSHPAPCALFVSAHGTRHAFAFVGLAPKFFRWNHGAPHRMEPTEPTNPKIKSEAAWQFQHLIKKRHGATQQPGQWGQSGVEAAIGAWLCRAGGAIGR
jgi:hypothetical protein